MFENYPLKEFVQNLRDYYDEIFASLLEEGNYNSAIEQLENLRVVLLNITDKPEYLTSLDSFISSLSKGENVKNSRAEFEKKLGK